MTYTKFVTWIIGAWLVLVVLYIATNVSNACKARKAQEEAEQRREQAVAEKAAKRAKRETEPAEKQVAADVESRQHNDGTPGASDVAQETPVSRSGMPSTLKALGIRGNNAFAGQTVAFTGTLPNMPRAAAIAAVVANGGKAYETMPAGTTLLVVGDKPGMNKLDKADKWIGQVRKITPAQFKAMLRLPLTLTPDQFAAMIAAQ